MEGPAGPTTARSGPWSTLVRLATRPRRRVGSWVDPQLDGGRSERLPRAKAERAVNGAIFFSGRWRPISPAGKELQVSREESAKGKALRGRLSSPPPGQCGWRDQTRGCVLSVNPRTPPRSASPPPPPPPLRSPDLQRRRQRHRGLQCHKGVRFAAPMAPPFPHRSRTPAGRGGPWVPGGPRRPAPGPIPRPPGRARRRQRTGKGPSTNVG